MIKIKKFIFGAFSENTYTVYDTETKEALILDPGNMDPYEDQILCEFIDKNELKVKYIIATHSHIDHLLGVKSLKAKYDCLFLAPEADMPLLMNIDQQGALFGLEVDMPPKPDGYISGNTEIKLGDKSASFIFTPGHTPGEHCLYFEEDQMLFSGDVLFKDSIGRTDLWGGSYQLLLDSISEKLLNLPDGVTVYPGHGDVTNIAYERKNNPFIQ
jgi:hydroxyacylglutathione hydrolase